MEIWKDVINFENIYKVSNLGNVVNKLTNATLIGDLNSVGYRRITLYDKSRNLAKRVFVHRLVAFHFCEGYSPELVVNHKDGNKLNNCADNLEYCTRSENDLHAFKMGLRTINVDHLHREHYLFTKDESANSTKLFRSKQEFANYYNVPVTSIQYLVNCGHLKVSDNHTVQVKHVNPFKLINPIIFSTKN